MPGCHQGRENLGSVLVRGVGRLGELAWVASSAAKSYNRDNVAKKKPHNNQSVKFS
jgi:hypothetical protein